jgi:hypothetical protein
MLKEMIALLLINVLHRFPAYFGANFKELLLTCDKCHQLHGSVLQAGMTQEVHLLR